jgi:hypothetical protein
VQDSIRQSLKAPEGNVTPDNSEFVNNLSTGPTLTFRLGDRAALTMSGLYSRLSYEDSPLDANTLSGTVGISTALPGDGSLGLFGRVAGTSGVAGESGYDLRSAYVRYQRGLQSSNSLSLDAGYIESLHEGVTSGGPLVLLSLQRQISGLSSVFLNASRTITNTAEIRAIEALGTAEHDRPISQPGSVESSGADAGWKVGGRRNTLALGGGWRKEEYNSAPQFDRKVSYVSATFSRRLRSTLTANLDVRYNTEDFADPTLPEFDYQTVVLSLQQMFGRRLSGGLTTVYSHRSDKVASGYEFTEWRYGLTIGYLLTEPTR